MIYFTSDLHLNHKAAIHMNGRSFANIDEMNETLIANINSRVSEEDTLYLLGDVAYRGGVDKANQLISRINGRKILISGNHDHKSLDPGLFESIHDFLEIHVDGINISLMHYPMVSWPKKGYGSLHLHGHQHNSADYNYKQRICGILRYDVGVDANNYYPVSLEEIKSFFRFVPTDSDTEGFPQTSLPMNNVPTYSREEDCWYVNAPHGVVYGDISYVVSEFCGDGLFYHYWIGNNPREQDHTHGFEGVLEAVIQYPESFSIQGFENQYSMQEKRLLLTLQNKLLGTHP